MARQIISITVNLTGQVNRRPGLFAPGAHYNCRLWTVSIQEDITTFTWTNSNPTIGLGASGTVIYHVTASIQVIHRLLLQSSLPLISPMEE